MLRTFIITTCLLLSLPGFAQDSDADAVPDIADAFPCDSNIAGQLYVPAAGQHGALLFEDQWPELGDADFNDVVIAYAYNFALDGDGLVRGITAIFDVLALGGNFNNGLGLHLPISANDTSVTQTIGAGPPVAVVPGADAELTVHVTRNLRELFGSRPGPINAISGPSTSSQRVVLHVDLAQPVSADIVAEAPFDVFIFRSDDPSHEIHRTSYPGTAMMRGSLFGTASDRSSVGRYFVDSRNLPFVMDLPQFDKWPNEGEDIGLLFPGIVPFAASGGTTHLDFYSNGVDATYAYRGAPPVTPQPIAAILAQTDCTADSDRDLYTDGEEARNGTAPLDPTSPDRLVRVLGVSSRANTSCEVDEVGLIDCWGYDGFSVVSGVPTAGTWRQVSVGGYHGCAIDATGALHCWGLANRGVLEGAPNTGRWTQVTVGVGFACALDEPGGVYCWGDDSGGAVSGRPTGQGWREISAGSFHACAVSASGGATCWGATQGLPVGPPSPNGWKTMAAGHHFSCGISTTDRVSCWGQDNWQQSSGAPASGAWASVSAGVVGACAISTTGALACWGDGANSVLRTQTPRSGTWTAVAVGDTHACAISTQGRTTCWGNNSHGQVDGGPRRLAGPAHALVASHYGRACALDANGRIECWPSQNLSAPASPGWTDLSVGAHHGCSIDAQGALQCWGTDYQQNISGQPRGRTWRIVRADANHTCGIDTGGAIACWGAAWSTSVINAPTAGTWTALDTGPVFSCALDSAGEPHCWGDLVPVLPLGPFLDISVGEGVACALRASGRLSCWGSNVSSASPLILAGMPATAEWTEVSVGRHHACARSESGGVHCWGLEASIYKSIADTPASHQWSHVVAGFLFSCGTSLDGNVSCWGFSNSAPRGPAPDVNRNGVKDYQEQL